MKSRSPVIALFVVLALAVAILCYVWLQKPDVTRMPGPENVSVAVPANAIPAAERPVDVAVEEFRQPSAPRTQGEIVGIGAVLRKDTDTGATLITGAVPNSPAAAAGLAGNFVIRKIDDTVTEGMALQECVTLLRGAAGTIVRLELFDVDANEIRTVELTRQKIQLKEL